MKRRLIVVSMLCALALVAATACSIADVGGESEFSPDTLDRRGRHNYYVGDYVAYRTEWSYSRDGLAEFLVDNGYWTPTHPPEPRWILMTTFRGSHGGDTALYRELSGDWIRWSRAHPELARRLWPYALRLLRGGPVRYDGLGLVKPEAVVEDLLAKVRRVEKIADLERELKLFDDLTKQTAAVAAPGR
jgi:hypothetical protein